MPVASEEMPRQRENWGDVEENKGVATPKFSLRRIAARRNRKIFRLEKVSKEKIEKKKRLG